MTQSYSRARDVRERVAVTLGYLCLIAALAAANYIGARRVDNHLRGLCRHGISTACALDGRR